MQNNLKKKNIFFFDLHMNNMMNQMHQTLYELY